MAKTDNLTDFLTDLANTIRTKKGTSGTINAQNFSSEIASISSGTDVSDTTATAGDVLSGKDFYLANGTKTSGSITTYSGSTSITPTTSQQTISTSGKYVASDITVGAIPNNYKDTTNADATAGDILYGKVAVNGSGDVTGTIQTYSGATTITENGIVATAGKYLTSDLTVSVSGGSQNPNIEILTQDSNGYPLTLKTNNYTKIPGYMFSNYSWSISRGSFWVNVTDIQLNSGITDIGIYAFYYCYGLTSINIPNGVTRIRQNAFANCSNLSSVSLPNTLTTIDTSAFSSCTSLTSIVIPNSVKYLRQAVFSSCSNLSSVTLSNTLGTIENQCFSWCTSLTSIVIPSSVVSIDQTAFTGSNNMQSVKFLGQVPNLTTLFNGFSKVELYDFRGCTTVPTLSDASYFGHKANCQVVIPDDLYNDWTGATNWVSITDITWVKASNYLG